jgi:chromatin assembly factor 1 subunit B
VWRITQVDTFKPQLTCVAELKRHEKPVNVVRFSPDGTFIATGGDGNFAFLIIISRADCYFPIFSTDAYIILWKCGEEKTGKEEGWMFEKSLRKHIEDVSDLSWSPDCNFLVSASIDNSAVLWDVKKVCHNM